MDIEGGRRVLSLNKFVCCLLPDIEEFFIQPESMSVINGNATVLECVSGKSAPPVFVRWEKDGQLFTQVRNLTNISQYV